MSKAYYNEIEPYCAEWLRNLIREGLIPDGDVDDRSIRDVQPSDLRGYTQAHFFAGLGGWAYALRLAGWPDDREVWTGSCPCQPFSAAGKRKGFADDRHLWPVWFPLIRECRPSVVFGEQVASKDGLAWLDIVSTDMEEAQYAFGAADMCVAGVGAPHIRQRLWFVAYADGGNAGAERVQRSGQYGQQQEDGSARLGMGDAGTVLSPQGESSGERSGVRRFVDEPIASGTDGVTEGDRWLVRLGNTGSSGLARRSRQSRDDAAEQPAVERAGGPTNGFWERADWIECTDGKARPVEPGTFPLAHGIPARVAKLRAFGNAISPQVAAEFITAVSD
jgi:DNA (cytosine-5)-methyltransferase 1